MQTGLRQGSACPPGSRRARRAVTRWLADPQVRSAAGLWLASKAMLAVLAWAASWVMRPAGQAAPLWAAWEHWDAAQFRLIAERGYGRLAGSDRIAFLPGFPLLLRAAHLLIGSWAADELVVTSAASFLAVLGLIRLADDCRPGSGTRAAVFLLASPAAVFLSVGYSEAAFLAAALPAWRAARAGRWTRAAVLAAVACAIRVSGIFVLAGLAVLAVQEVTSGLPAAARDATSRSRGAPGAARTGPPAAVRRPAAARSLGLAARLAIPLLPLAAYEAYLYRGTGDWLAWDHAERAGWGRYFGDPVRTFTTTWRAAFGLEFRPPLAFMFQLELAAMAVLAGTAAWLAWRRRWAEAVYAALTVAAFGFGTWYESVPRALLLMWPLWCGLAGLAGRRRLAGWLWLAVSAPLMVVTALLYLSGSWAG